VHKKVCGAKGSPFTWPLLSPEEKKQIFDLWDVVPYHEYGEDVPPTMAEAFRKFLGRDRKEMEVRSAFPPFPSPVESSVPPFQPSTLTSQYLQRVCESLVEGGKGRPLPQAPQQQLLDLIRGQVAIVATTSALSIGTNDDVLLSNNAWQQTCAAYGTICQTLTTPLPDKYASTIKHRLVTYVHLSQVAVQSDPDRRKELTQYASRISQSIREYLRDEVAKTHPIEAMKVAKEHALTYIPLNDRDLPPGFPSPKQDPAFYCFKV
jgi:hypothetical protein